jgi:hypothetical protein
MKEEKIIEVFFGFSLTKLTPKLLALSTEMNVL